MIDAHVHLWRLGVNDCRWPTAADGAIFRDVEAAELIATLDAAGVDRALLVQSQESARDTAWLLEIAAAEKRIAGVVGWADLADRAAVVPAPGLKGLRPMVQGLDADWYDHVPDASWAAMADAGLVLDALIRPIHLPALARLAARHPALAIVIDHGAKPDIAGGTHDAWREAFAAVAERPNVCCKLSGLLTEKAPDQPTEAVLPYVATLLDLFGAERLIWGSDWPVLTGAGDYRRWLTLAQEAVPAAHHRAVFNDNAARVYRLSAA